MEQGRNQSLGDSPIVGYWDWNIVTGEYSLSPSIFKYLGYKNDFPPKNLVNIPEICKQFINTTQEKSPPFELTLKHKNGSTVPLLCSRNIFQCNDEGLPSKMIGCFIEKQSQVEAYNRKLFNNSPIGFAVCTTDGVLTDVNQAYADILGRSIEECYSLSYWDITPRKYESDEEIQLSSLKTKGSYGPYEKEYIHKDGHLVPVILNGTLLDINGETHIWSTVEDISERKKIEGELQTEQERLMAISTRTNVGTWEWNVQTGETVFNDRWAEIVGYTLDELAPISIETWVKLCHPKDMEESDKKLKKCFDKSKEIYECEVRMRHKNGFWVWVLDRGRVVSWTEDGQPLKMMGTHLDISEKKNALEKLRDSESTLDKFFNQPIDLHIIAGFDGTIERVNHGFKDILGYSSAELLGKSFFSLIHPDDIQETEQEMGELSKGKTTFYFENRYQNKNGKYHLIAWSAVASVEDQKVFAIGNDITKRREAEDKIRKNEQLLSELVKRIPSILYRFEPKEGGVYYSPRAAEVLGYEHEYLINNPMLWHDSIHPEDVPLVEEAIKNAADGKSFKIKYRIKDSKATWRTFVDQSISINAKHGKLQRIDGVVDDITKELSISEERKNLAEQLYQSQKMEAMGQMAGGVAHDFNNSLAVIMGTAEIITLGYLSKQEVIEHAANIMKMAEHSSALTKKLLMFSRKMPHHFVSLDLVEVIDDTIEMLNHSINKNINIQKKIFVENASIIGDPSMLQNAFINMGINASHAMPKGGDLIFEMQKRSLSERESRKFADEIPAGEYFELKITDTGTGISDSIIQKIFDPFFSTKEQGEGTGLGLSTVLGTIQEHGGRISVNSRVNEGTTFSILLPEKILANKSPQEKGPLVPKSGTILLVDDEPLIRDIGTLILERSGFKILSAENGRSGFEIFLKNKDSISAIILDIIMPVMDGIEALEKIREIDKEVPVIISSGYGSSKQLSKLGNLKYDIFLRKPFQKNELLKAINQVLK